MKPFASVLLSLVLSYSHCVSLSSMTSLKSKTLLSTRTKLISLSQYLMQKPPHIEVDLNQIQNTSKLFAFISPDQASIYISSTPNIPNSQRLIAEGEYLKTRFKTGWDKFNSKTYSTANPITQCFAAGIIEGLLSSDEIYAYRQNYEYFFAHQKEIDTLKAFLTKINANIEKKLSFQLSNDLKANDIKELAYLGCLHAQMKGLHKGYSLIAPSERTLDLSDLYFLNTEGYYSYILAYLSFNDVKKEDSSQFKSDEDLFKYYNTTNIEDIWKTLTKRSHCSAIIKLMKDKAGTPTDLYVGHSTWSGYNELLRTLKHVKYAFEGSNQIIGMKPFEMKFSSYPGILFSGDEFYLKDNMVIMQTSLSVINQLQFKNAIEREDSYIPEFMRIMILNFISDSGKDWVDNYKTFQKDNHLYVAQWMIIDYNNMDKEAGLLHIVEEFPKSVKSIDYTQQLRDSSYYGSFNLPLFKESHSKIAGFDIFSDINFFGKDYNPRKYLLEQLEGDIKTLKDFEDTLMYNGYLRKSKIKDDPSYSDPSNGIASRTINGHDGAIDFKIVSKRLINEDKIYVYSGPVYENNPNFEVYDLNKESSKIQTYSKGMPRVWNFKPFTYY